MSVLKSCSACGMGIHKGYCEDCVRQWQEYTIELEQKVEILRQLAAEGLAVIQVSSDLAFGNMPYDIKINDDGTLNSKQTLQRVSAEMLLVVDDKLRHSMEKVNQK